MNKSIFVIILILVLALVVSGIAGCPMAKEKPKIREIISNPKIYEGNTIVIEGKFGGWSGNLTCDYNKMVMKTRSDTIIYDETGCLYMTRGVKGLKELDPANETNIGENLTILAIVGLIDGKPILIDHRCRSWEPGPCEMVISLGYFYNWETKKCEFSERGSGCSSPPFKTLEECQKACE